MVIRKIQKQPVYGTPTDRTYCRLRLPQSMAFAYVEEHGERHRIWVESPDTLCIGPGAAGAEVRILNVREMRRAIYHHFKQVMFPVEMSRRMLAGEDVDVTRDGDTIRLKFGRDAFGPADPA